MLLQRNKNYYDIFIIVLLASLAFGNIGGSLQISRIVAILGAPLLFKHINLVINGLSKYALFFISLISYSIISLLWSPSKIRGIEELIYYIIHFIIFFEVIVFSRCAKTPWQSISYGWLLAVLLTLSVAAWEISTDNHLSMSVQQAGTKFNTGTEVIDRKFASVTFGNYNSYVTFLCLALPFIFYSINKPNNRFIIKIISIVSVIGSFIIVLYNASRGGLLCIVVLALIYLLTLKRKSSSFFVLIFIMAVLFCLLYWNGEDILKAIIARSADGQLFKDSSRFKIWYTAILTFLDTLGLGTGIGGLTIWMDRFARGGINIPHNLFLEVFVQFGWLIGILFCLFVLNMFSKIKYARGRTAKITIVMALVTLPIVAIINSTYLLTPHVFAYFASIIVFTDRYVGNPISSSLRNQPQRLC